MSLSSCGAGSCAHVNWTDVAEISLIDGAGDKKATVSECVILAKILIFLGKGITKLKQNGFLIVQAVTSYKLENYYTQKLYLSHFDFRKEG